MVILGGRVFLMGVTNQAAGAEEAFGRGGLVAPDLCLGARCR